MKYKDFVKQQFAQMKNVVMSAPQKKKIIAAKWRAMPSTKTKPKTKK